MATSGPVEALSNAVSGIGRTIDVAAELGNGSTLIPKAIVVSESTLTAGAAILQSGVASAAGITWTNVGSPTNLNPGVGQLLTSPGAPVAFIRVVVGAGTATLLSGGKCTVIVTG